MNLEIINSTLLKPSGSDFSLNTRIPLTIFDRANYDDHFSFLQAFPKPMPSNKELTAGLTNALDLFPVLRGRINPSRSCIQLNNAGTKLLEARARCPLSMFLDGSANDTVVEQPAELSLLYPPFSSVEELFQLQITRFSCGGVVLGMTFHHSITDGHSMSHFLSKWADIVREPRPKDQLFPTNNINRAALLVPRDPPTSVFNHQEIEFNLNNNAATPIGSGSCDPKPHIKNFMVEFSPSFIADLKAMVPGRRSTLGCIVAHLWKKITHSRNLKSDEITHVRIAVNGRMKSRLHMPEFFGNLVLWAFPKLSVERLLSGTLADTVKVIHEAIASVNNEYFKSFVDFGKIMEGREEELTSSLMLDGSRLSPNMEVNGLLGFKYHELEFIKGNKPCAFIIPDISAEGVIMLAPSCKEKGGVVAFLALLKDDAEEFKRTCFILE